MTDHRITKEQLLHAYQITRKKTEELCLPLEIEDYVIQSIDDVSPPKWHLAHTTWFFETFILIPVLRGYSTFHPQFHHLFNSYYQRIGHPFPRVKRGLLSRPTVKTIYDYRHYVDQHLQEFLDQLDENQITSIKSFMILGLQHEQQHQELLLMDIKHNFSLHPEFPSYHKPIATNQAYENRKLTFDHVEGGIVEIGCQGDEFCFDNELPRHQHIIKPYAIATRLITNGEYKEFMESGGYEKPDWWLSDGWDCVQKNHWQAPLYWHKRDNKWYHYTLSGLKEVEDSEPVSHVSYYEADAYARWSNGRLPTEVEWEHYVRHQNLTPAQGNFLEDHYFHPQPAKQHDQKISNQFFGDAWEWTSSSYSPYPGYKMLSGALGEYNGKFMSNQMVLRGGCCVTPESHIRASYRNFFQPEKRWQFSGIRIASDAKGE